MKGWIELIKYLFGNNEQSVAVMTGILVRH